MGYHIKKITKGTLGELSKIREELEELEDSLEQQNKILAMCELADLYGALEHFLKNNFPNLTMEDLKTMADATGKAFQDGSRRS